MFLSSRNLTAGHTAAWSLGWVTLAAQTCRFGQITAASMAGSLFQLASNACNSLLSCPNSLTCASIRPICWPSRAWMSTQGRSPASCTARQPWFSSRLSPRVLSRRMNSSRCRLDSAKRRYPPHCDRPPAAGPAPRSSGGSSPKPRCARLAPRSSCRRLPWA